MIIRFCMLLLCLFFMPVLAVAQDTSAAYASIPHRQTTYSAALSVLNRNDATSLESLFTAIDEAICIRVSTLNWFRDTGPPASSFVEYSRKMTDIRTVITNIPVSKKIVPAREFILEALAEQQDFYRDWMMHRQRKETFPYLLGPNDPVHPKVSASSRKLITAYSILKRAYPHESKHNLRAFYDHLCALDFI